LRQNITLGITGFTRGIFWVEPKIVVPVFLVDQKTSGDRNEVGGGLTLCRWFFNLMDNEKGYIQVQVRRNAIKADVETSDPQIEN